MFYMSHISCQIVLIPDKDLNHKLHLLNFSKQSNLNDVNVSFGVYRWRFERNCDKVEATERRFTKLGSHEVLANIDLP